MKGKTAQTVLPADSQEAERLLRTLPRSWRELRTVTTLQSLQGSTQYLCFTPDSIRIDAVKEEPARAHVDLCLASGEHVMAILSGPIDRIQADLERARAGRLIWYGSCNRFNGRVWMRSISWHEPADAGRIIPKYPRGAQLPRGEALLRACATAARALAADTPGGGGRLAAVLESKLREVHAPSTLLGAEKAMAWLSRYAAHRVAEKLLLDRREWRAHPGAAGLNPGQPALDPQGITPTPEQARAVAEILGELASSHRMHRILVGDVGSGKTLVFGQVAATCVNLGWRVGIIAPSRILAEQTAAALSKWYPTLDVCLGALPQGEPPAAFYVGTTELLSGARPELLIVDEQHRFSPAQREALTRDGAHLLEATATLIPRTHALIEARLVTATTLEGVPVDKDVRTRLVTHDKRATVLQGMQTVFAQDPGAQALIVYPAREKAAESRRSAISAYEDWCRQGWVEAGEVSLIHAALDEREANEALAKMHSGKARVLVSTVITETGVDLPGLRVVVVVGAERFGLAQLHQIRGRVARRGGRGYCLLITGPKLKPKAETRLREFCLTTKGSEIAEIDRALRGGGDLSMGAQAQHGDMEGSPIPGLALSTGEVIQAVEERRRINTDHQEV